MCSVCNIYTFSLNFNLLSCIDKPSDLVRVPCWRDTKYPKTLPQNSNAGEKSTTEFETFYNSFQHFIPKSRKVIIYKLRSILHCGEEIVLPRFLINCFFFKRPENHAGSWQSKVHGPVFTGEYEATGPGHNYVQGFYCPGSCLFNTHSYLVFVSLCPLLHSLSSILFPALFSFKESVSGDFDLWYN